MSRWAQLVRSWSLHDSTVVNLKKPLTQNQTKQPGQNMLYFNLLSMWLLLSLLPELVCGSFKDRATKRWFPASFLSTCMDSETNPEKIMFHKKSKYWAFKTWSSSWRMNFRQLKRTQMFPGYDMCYSSCILCEFHGILHCRWYQIGLNSCNKFKIKIVARIESM